MTLDRDRPKPQRKPVARWVIPTIVIGSLVVLGFVFLVLALSGQRLF